MGTGARGVSFQSNPCRLPLHSKILQNRFGTELSLHCAQEAAEWRFYDVQAACKALFREKRRQGSALRRAAGMETLRHRASPCGIETRCLRPADAKCMRGLAG